MELARCTAAAAEEEEDEEEGHWLSLIQDPDNFSGHGSRSLEKSGHVAHRVIVHIDMDCFYAQVEMIRNPDLKDKPLGVQQKYIVVTCNYEARKLGVQKLMSVRDAKEICPQLVLVCGEDLTPYRDISYKVTGLLEEFSPRVERLGFDENFIDITELVDKRIQEEQQSNIKVEVSVSGHVYNGQTINAHDWMHTRIAAGSLIAAEMRAALYNRLGLTECAGVASNKLLSKLVSGTFKPNQQTILLPESGSHLINGLDHVKKIPGIGYKTAQRLESLGVSSIRDLQACPFAVLEKVFGGSAAQRMQMLSRGEDDLPVTPSGPPQSLSDEDSFKKCSTVSEVKLKMKELLNSLLNRLSKDGRSPHTLRLTLRQFTPTNKWFNRESRQCPIPTHIIQNLGTENADITASLVELLMKLFGKMINVKMPFHLTLLNVCFSNLKASNSTKGSIGFYLTPKTTPISTNASKSVQKQYSHILYTSLLLDQETEASENNLHHKNNPNISKVNMGSIKETHSTAHVCTKETDTAQSLSLHKDIDMDVFSQLPEDIRKEILSSPGVVGAHKSGPPSRTSLSSKGILHFFTKTNAGISSPAPVRESSLTEGQFQPCLPKPLDLGNVKESTQIIDSNSHKCSERVLSRTCSKEGPMHSQAYLTGTSTVSSTVAKLSCSDNACTMDTSVENVDTDTEVGAVMDCTEPVVTFPKNVDPNVFSELPAEVQRELMAEWRQQKRTPKIQVKKQHEKTKVTKGKRSRTSAQPNSLLQYFKPS
ncbi:hypothetical protein FKM82_000076 [Ascaphus truei]